MVRHTSNGTVTASCRGLMASGPTERAALEELARLVKAADRAAREETGQFVPLVPVAPDEVGATA